MPAFSISAGMPSGPGNLLFFDLLMTLLKSSLLDSSGCGGPLSKPSKYSIYLASWFFYLDNLFPAASLVGFDGVKSFPLQFLCCLAAISASAVVKNLFELSPLFNCSKWSERKPFFVWALVIWDEVLHLMFQSMPVSLHTTFLTFLLLLFLKVRKCLVSVGQLKLERVNSCWILQQCEIEPS